MEESTLSPKTNPTDEEKSDKSVETNHEFLQMCETFGPAINIPENFYHNIKLKLVSLSDRDKILQVKLNKYQKKHENLNMFIIFVSTVLGVYETFRVKIDSIIETKFLDVTTNLIPIILSGIITCTASIVKLKKYQEKCDNIHLVREKVSVARSNLKTVQEHLLFCRTPEELTKIQRIYLRTTFNSYCQAQSYLDKYVSDVDKLKYGDNEEVKEIINDEKEEENNERMIKTIKESDMNKSYDFRNYKLNQSNLIVQKQDSIQL